jgi:hypothetical protein
MVGAYLIFSNLLTVREAVSDMHGWIERTKLSGDARMRYQYEEQTDREDRHRGRMRFRYGFEMKLNDQVKVGLRLASGSADPASTNQTFHNTFSSKEIWLDRAYLVVRPVPHLSVTGGKMQNPFYSTDLMWDGDVNLEGVSIHTETPSGFSDLFLTGGVFPLAEYKVNSDDPVLLGAQGGISARGVIGKKAAVTLSYYNFFNLQDKAIEDVSPAYQKRTNTLEERDGLHYFTYAYSVVDANLMFTPLEIPLLNRLAPLTIYGNYLQNVASEVEEGNRAWLAGLKLGSVKGPGDFELAYNYREIEKDALPAMINDSDFHGGGTNGKGHKLGAKIGVFERTSLGITYFITEESTGDPREHNTLQVDFVTKF